MELLWPEIDPEVGRRNLHQAVYSLRRTLRSASPAQHIVFDNECYPASTPSSRCVDMRLDY